MDIWAVIGAATLAAGGKMAAKKASYPPGKTHRSHEPTRCNNLVRTHFF